MLEGKNIFHHIVLLATNRLLFIHCTCTVEYSAVLFLYGCADSTTRIGKSSILVLLVALWLVL